MAKTPEQRARVTKKEINRVRRRYKVDLSKRKKFIPGEEEFAADMVIVLKLAGYSNNQIGQTIGISKGQVKQFLDRKDVSEKLAILRAKLPSAALELLQGYLIEAVQAVVDVMRRSHEDKMILQAAAEIFDRGGLPKASRQERVQENTHKTVITDDGIVESLREASPEVQEKAAVLIEDLEKLLKQATGTEDEPDS
jgi:hypothetical protein